MMTNAEHFAKPEIEKLLQRMTCLLREALPAGVFEQREAATLEVCNEVARRAFREELQEIADGFTQTVEYHGQVYRQHQLASVSYPSLCGPIEVNRFTYRRVGVRNGPTIVPMDLDAGIIEGVTPALARNVAHGYGENHMRAHLVLLEKAHRVPPPRATLERIAKRLAADVVKKTSAVEPKVRRLERVPEKANAIVIGVDRTSAPMEEPSEKPAKPRTKPYLRNPRAPVEVNYRMAYAATVSLVDGDGETLITRRYAIEASDSEQDMMARAMADVRHYLTQRRDLKVAVVQDGAHEMWNLVRPELSKLRTERLLRCWSEAIDFCHLAERLNDALELCGDTARSWRLESWRADLEATDRAIDSIAAFLRFHRTDPATEEQRSKLEAHITYLENNKDRMRYRKMRLHGLPIGSGVTESACKTLVNMRAKGAGQRWHCRELGGVLNLRAITASDRFDAFWAIFARMHAANVNNCVVAA